MKRTKLFAGLLSIALAITAVAAPVGDKIGEVFGISDIEAIADSSTLDVTFNAPYGQSEARRMLDMVNDFRTGSEAWAWNETNTEKVYYSGLGELTFDYELEKIAMQRAAELVASYSHTRPDGSKCFTAYTDTYTYSAKGENIAIGTSDLTAEEAFALWREDEEDYSGQGHRRNMLGENYNAIGIAHVYYNGCHYWVQELSSVVGSDQYTEPVDSEKPVNISISNSLISSVSLTAGYTSAELNKGDTEKLPAVYKSIATDTWEYAPVMKINVDAQWSVSDGASVISLTNDGRFTALNSGTGVLTASYENNNIDVNVSVDRSDFSYDTMSDGSIKITDYKGSAEMLSIPSVIDGKKVTSIGNYAFLACENVKTLRIPNSVTKIGDMSLAYCYNLTDIYYSGSEVEWAKIEIGSNNQSLSNALIHYDGDNRKEMTGTVYYQIKTDDSAVRFIAEVDIADVVNSGSGSILISANEQEFDLQIKTAYRALVANGKTIHAADGKCYVISSAIRTNNDGGDTFNATFTLDSCKGSISRVIMI